MSFAIYRNNLLTNLLKRGLKGEYMKEDILRHREFVELRNLIIRNTNQYMKSSVFNIWETSFEVRNSEKRRHRDV